MSEREITDTERLDWLESLGDIIAGMDWGKMKGGLVWTKGSAVDYVQPPLREAIDAEMRNRGAHVRPLPTEPTER